MTARAKRVKYAFTVFLKRATKTVPVEPPYIQYTAVGNSAFTVGALFPAILAFTIGHLLSGGTLALPPTKLPKTGVGFAFFKYTLICSLGV